ncbi:interleukin-1 receptor-associated kinase 4-like [Diadema antillarum]|uniref:interleukin-1 receptor-associated kinase 4-like n=1 Tax=Diadema antillarum TaxID=105358 RepID=UPI003A845A42
MAAVTADTLVRNLPLSVRRELALFLDSTSPTYLDWRGMMALLPRRPGSNELKYTARHESLFERVAQRPNGSPTLAILDDWGTTNVRVSDLLAVLAKMKHDACMEALLPGSSEEYLDEGPAQEIPHNPVVPERPAPVAPEPHQPLAPDPHQPSAPVPDDPSLPPIFEPNKVQRFSYEELCRMTNRFDQRDVADGGCRIAEGGFGTVFKGRFADNEPCAVKKLKDVTSGDINVKQQFDDELSALCKLRHRNLVVLFGYCCEPPNLCLVYELMSGGSLKDRLALTGQWREPLTWQERMSIARGAASGLKFLHDSGFIHRDIKSANILLDGQLTAKVCDFGLVRDRSESLGTDATHFNTQITIGSTLYMAPEAASGEYSYRTDVYSFGLVLLELLTGMLNRHEAFILSVVDSRMEECGEDKVKLIDPLASDWNKESAVVMYDLAMDCTDQKPRRRPTISELCRKLEATKEGV